MSASISANSFVYLFVALLLAFGVRKYMRGEAVAAKAAQVSAH
jgi:hypothetical protein